MVVWFLLNVSSLTTSGKRMAFMWWGGYYSNGGGSDRYGSSHGNCYIFSSSNGFYVPYTMWNPTLLKHLAGWGFSFQFEWSKWQEHGHIVARMRWRIWIRSCWVLSCVLKIEDTSFKFALYKLNVLLWTVLTLLWRGLQVLVGDFQKKKSPKLDRTSGLLFPSEVFHSLI